MRLGFYLIRQHIPPFVASVSIFTLIAILNRLFQLMKMLVQKGVPLWKVLEIMVLIVPFMLFLTVPMGVLMASIVVSGRMTQDKEIIALWGSGIRSFRFLKYPFFAVLIMSIFFVYFNSFIVPKANHKLREMLFEIKYKKPAGHLEEGVFSPFGNYNIYIEKKNEKTNEIFKVVIQQILGDTSRTIIAKKGKFFTFDDYLVLYLENGRIYETYGRRKEIFRELKFYHHRIKIPISEEELRKIRRYRHRREIPSNEILKEVKKYDKRIKKEIKAGRKIVANFLKKAKARLEVEFWYRIVLPVSCLIFIFMGFPIGLRLGKGGWGNAFGVAFLIFVVYYILLVSMEELSAKAFLKASIFMWIPNLISLIFTIYLYVKNKIF